MPDVGLTPELERFAEECVRAGRYGSVSEVARLGGYLARTRDPPAGNIVMWRGWTRLADIPTGYSLARRCG
ncbi:MAG: hypothetical protein JOY89_15875 [Solirubrobacterales bacterium]|nr:hypothetical protein [Solirubrobacterales bacterium]